MFSFRAYPVYTVGDSTTLYPIANAGQAQGQYYAAPVSNSGGSSTTAVTGATVGYSASTGQYVVQHTVDPESLLPTSRIAPQAASVVSNKKA